MEELKELHGEGGSDVFTSTRHVNPNAVSIVILTGGHGLKNHKTRQMDSSKCCHLTNIFCSITGTKHKRFQDEVLEQR